MPATPRERQQPVPGRVQRQLGGGVSSRQGRRCRDGDLRADVERRVWRGRDRQLNRTGGTNTIHVRHRDLTP